VAVCVVAFAISLAVQPITAMPLGALPLEWTAEERGRMMRGEVLVRLQPVRLDPAPRAGIREGIAVAVLDSPPDRLYRALLDLANYHEWAPFVARSVAHRLPGGAVEQEQWLDLPAPLTDRHVRLRAHGGREGEGDAGRWRVEWAKVPGAGNVRAYRGEWVLAPTGDGRTLISCRLYVDPAGRIPAWMVNRTVARALPWILDGLRQQAHRWRYDPRAGS
jgi:hypothetical protein